MLSTLNVKRMLDSVDPLHHAARSEHATVVRLLLASGACPTRSNMYGKRTPGELAEPDGEARKFFEEDALVVPSH